MIKQIIFIGLLICILCSNSLADNYCSSSGTGVFGTTLTCTGLSCDGAGSASYYKYYMDCDAGNIYNYTAIAIHAYENQSGAYSMSTITRVYTGGSSSNFLKLNNVGDSFTRTFDNIPDGDANAYISIKLAACSSSAVIAMDAIVIVTLHETIDYTISGDTTCISMSELYIKNNDGNYLLVDNDNVGDSYSFTIIDGFEYRLSLDDHNYDFTVNGSNINYNYDGCSHTTYRFKELCDNLIPDSEGYYTEYINGAWGLPHFFSESSGVLDISNSSATKIRIFTTPFSGIAGWVIDPVITDTKYTLANPNIFWGLKVIVQNESDGTLIDGATVQVLQDCYCTSGTSTRQKMTVSGMAGFIDMSLQDASLLVMKTGYKPIDENSTGYSAFLSGRANFSSKTWICKLAPSWSNNSSSFYEVNNTVGIHFVDESGNRTTKIKDTDSEVYLYYENNNTEEEAMTMRFESSSTHTYFMPELQWTIAYDDIGHKTIANSYFTPWDYSYRAVIYNSSIYGWNITIPLTVRNATKETEAHYENLSSSIFFMYARDGKIDHRETMKIGIHACSNNTTLMTTDIELWKDGVYLCHKNLTASDYTGSAFPYYYIWSPVYDYTSGSNYSVRMYGFDRTLLETDYVECVTDSTTRKNKLTIGVKDRSGTNLGNCYIYLEGWGSLSTGALYYNAYEGIENGEYRYKASKSGYLAVDGWIDVTIEDSDKIVWYTLIDDSESGAPTQTKMSDDDIKGFFLPLMFMLLICILLGGLRYAAN